MYVDAGNRLPVAVNSQGLGPIRPVMQLSFPGAVALRRRVPSGVRDKGRGGSGFACFCIFQ